MRPLASRSVVDVMRWDVATQVIVGVGRALAPLVTSVVPGLIGQEFTKQSFGSTPSGRLGRRLLAISHESSLDRLAHRGPP